MVTPRGETVAHAWAEHQLAKLLERGEDLDGALS